MCPMHRRLALQLVLLMVACSSDTLARAADLYVICNSTVSVTAADVHDMFLGEKQFVGATKLVPVDNSAAQGAFLEKILGMSAAKYVTTWTKKSFRDGINPPLITGSDVEAISYVKRTAGACSYITTPVPAGVAVIARL
jgi:hypothetical protein